mgnify:CR=1 FL=1
MNPITTANEYVNMSSADKKRMVKHVLRKANEDQLALIKRYDKAVAENKIQPID